MPDVTVPTRQGEASSGLAIGIEQGKLDAFGDGTENSEIGTAVIDRGTERRRYPGYDHFPRSLIVSSFQMPAL